MPIPFEIADKIFRAEKRLLGPYRWEPVENAERKEQRRRLECRVALGEAVPRGVFFRATTFPGSLTRMTFQLETDLPEGRRHVHLYRLETDPARPHVNKLYGPDEINGLFIPARQTHEHAFYDSLTSVGELRSSSCEQARIVAEKLNDFATALGRVCSRINVVNGGDVPAPMAQGELI